ncbi:50S ribosomal protein L1 [candidate division KSB1 bacterium]|nr:50S ribosomal protein L1 [candidate division KSB1 bacterium]
MKHSRRHTENIALLEKGTEYTLSEGISILKKAKSAKFDETVDVAIRLGVDPRRADQMIRGAVSLPHGTGKQVRVLVLASDAKQKEAKDAGADYVGLEDYLQKIQEGWLECDVIIATPDVMSSVGKFGKILGPRGMMPNPKSGTVTFDVAKAVQEVKAGKIEFRVERTGIVHVGVGKLSFDEQKIKENIKAFVETIIRVKPVTAKGQYIRSATISSTMGPGIRIDRNALMDEVK